MITAPIKLMFITIWSARLRELPLADGPGGFEQVVALLGIPTPMTPQLRRAFGKALAELRTALADAEASVLDAWIERRLLAPDSPYLIWPEKSRRLALARVRDGLKRTEKAEAGHRSSRIMLPTAAWQRLEAIQRSYDLKTRLEALLHAIACCPLKEEARSVSRNTPPLSKGVKKIKPAGSAGPLFEHGLKKSA
jgi:hypothetical protein